MKFEFTPEDFKEHSKDFLYPDPGCAEYLADTANRKLEEWCNQDTGMSLSELKRMNVMLKATLEKKTEYMEQRIESAQTNLRQENDCLKADLSALKSEIENGVVVKAHQSSLEVGGWYEYDAEPNPTHTAILVRIEEIE